MQYIKGLLGIALGLSIIKWRAEIKRFTGNIAFAEKYLGMGGTYTLFILIGALTVILSILYATGQLQGLMAHHLGKYF